MTVSTAIVLAASLSTIAITLIKKQKSSENDDHGLQEQKMVKNSQKGSENLEIMAEAELLRNKVKSLQHRKQKLEMKLERFHNLRGHQHLVIFQLQSLMDEKAAEAERLNAVANALKKGRQKLIEEVQESRTLQNQVEGAKAKLIELQERMQVDAEQVKGILVMLRDRVFTFEMEGVIDTNGGVDEKMNSVISIELEGVTLRRRNREIQAEKRELAVKLKDDQTRLTTLSTITEDKYFAKLEEEMKILRQVNKDLTEQVETLQNNRFSILEELVYQKWLCACLRFEIRDYHSHPNVHGKVCYDTQEGNKSLPSLPSFCSFSPQTSSADSDGTPFSITTPTSSSSGSQNSTDKEPSVTQKIKSLRRRKNFSSELVLESKSSKSRSGLIHRFPVSVFPLKTHSTLSSEISDVVPRKRRVSFNDSIKPVTFIYDENLPDSDDNVISLANEKRHGMISKKYSSDRECLSHLRDEAEKKTDQVHEEIKGIENENSIGDRIMNLIAASVLVFFLVLMLVTSLLHRLLM